MRWIRKLWRIGTRTSVGFRVVRRLEKEGALPSSSWPRTRWEIEILPTTEPRVDRTLNQAGFSHIGFIVEDFAVVEANLDEKGIRLEGVRDTSNGWKIGYLNDPEGNTIEFVRR